MRIDLYCDNCLKVINNINDNSIDLTITSPPYDDLREYDNSVDYKTLAKELYRITKNGGIVVWNINDRIKNGSKTLTSFNHCLIFREAGFNVNDVMIWKKTNPMPQVKQPRYNQCFEYMFIFSKGKPKTFNPIKIPCKNGGKEYKSTCKQITKGNKRVYKEMMINNYKIDNNIWEFAVSQNKTNHPAVFPLELPMRHIVSWSNENDLILDPFMGSGTVGVACKKLSRNFIGIEINENYYKIAKDRINQVESRDVNEQNIM